jgi:antitoxin (DNA-binding transcriptional repressor) of toxin-antitoxin stability system
MGIRELRDSMTSTVRLVRSGESIEITHDGKPVALLVPIPVDRLSRLIAAGEVRPARPLTRPLRRFRVTGPMDATRALEHDRAER